MWNDAENMGLLRNPTTTAIDKQTKEYLNIYNFLGLEDISTRYGISNEHVALVTFGHETKVQQRLTNNYKTLRELVGKILKLTKQIFIQKLKIRGASQFIAARFFLDLT
jgi:hypothetical protein